MVEKIEEEMCATKMQAETAATHEDPIIINESGLTQIDMEVMMRAEKEIEAKKMTLHRPVRTLMKQSARPSKKHQRSEETRRSTDTRCNENVRWLGLERDPR